MTWKSTAFVSGAGLLATWLASYPAPSTVQEAPPPTAARAATPPQASATSDIAQLADRLQRQNLVREQYTRPARNLFRFAGRTSASVAPLTAAAPVISPPSPAPAAAIRLSGVAMDRVDGQDVWTAILSTPSGVVLARIGEPVFPGWTLSTIESESVSITHPDGSRLNLPLSGK